MSETFNKISLYFRPRQRYWRAASRSSPEAMTYPIDFGPRLDDGHFSHFDRRGLPLRVMPGGMIHNYTRICGWALAHWSRWNGQSLPDDSAASVTAAANYMLGSGAWTDQGLELRAEVPGQGHVGDISAMSHGQAMSVLVRAHRLTGDEGYRHAAVSLLAPFRRAIGEGGVVSRLPGGRKWYEEDVRTPPRHILNGMIFALWGLADLARYAGVAEAKELYVSGIESLRTTIHRYDRGWWSTYDAPDHDRPYLASMRYHDLHVAQLEALAEDDETFAPIARQFRAYAASRSRRLRAALGMALAKARRDYRHERRGAPRAR